MSLSVDQLLERIQKGESLREINSSLIPADEQALLRCCAVVRTFDEALVDQYFRPHVGVDKESVPFSSLTEYDFVQRVPRTDGVYLLTPESRKKYYDAWWRSADSSYTVPPSEVPPTLIELSGKLFKHYTDLGDSAQLDALIQQVFINREEAWSTFQTLYKAADKAFDLARCRDIINALRGLESVLGPKRAEELNQTEHYLQARSSWATEYYQTVSYYDREKLSTALESFLTNGVTSDPEKKWILHLHAPGGMGKTMFVRWLISRRCLPEPYRIPCGRLDFDFVENSKVSKHRWRLFLDLAREIDRQIPGNIFKSLISKFTNDERSLDHQQTEPGTSPTPEQMDEEKKQEQKRENEILVLFGEAIKNAKLNKPVIFILDTLEEVILYNPNDFVEIVELIDRLRSAIPNLLVVLSGRYDLSEPKPDAEIRAPKFYDKFKDYVQTLEVEPFEREEALGFLQLRGLTTDRPLEIVVQRAEGNPFKLALFADILLDDPEITEETIRSYPTADLLYLIERVLARIPRNLHWLLRYGVVPRKLTLSFVKDVMRPHLLRAISGDHSNDNPQRFELLSEKAQKKIDEKKIFRVESPQHDLDLDQLWTELQTYAARSSWVTIKPSDPYTASFHSDVINPMRRWLEKEPVYDLLHEDARAYYEKKAQTNPGEWSTSMRNAVYHAFQLEGANAAHYWRQLMVDEVDAERRLELTSEIVGLEYVDDELKPRQLLDKREVIDLPTLAEAYFMLTSVRVELARLRNAAPNDKLWSDAENSLQKYERLQRGLSEPVATPAHVASTRAALLTNRGLGEQALAILEEALEEDPDERARMNLELELASSYSSRGDFEKALHFWESALQRAERMALSPEFTREMRRNLARLHRNNFDLEASARELQKVLASAGEDDPKLTGDLLNELIDLYFEMGQLAQARHTAEKLRSGLGTINLARWFNQSVKYLTAIGDPLKAMRALEGQESAYIFTDLEVAGPETRYALDMLLVESIEQRGTLEGLLFEIEPARESFERARSRWHERGDTKAVKRCMLKKAELFLNAGDIRQTQAILQESSRLSLHDDNQLMLEEGLLNLGIMHFTNEVEKRNEFAKTFSDAAVNAKWQPYLRARLMLQIGAWELSPGNVKAANKFFSELTEVLRQIRPESARRFLLDTLSEYPSFKELDDHVAQNLLELFPLQRDDADFHVYAPKVAELMRVLGRKDQAVALLKALMKSGPQDNLFAQRRLLLTLGRTAPRRGKQYEVTEFLEKFLAEYKEYSVLCAATLIEFAELSLGTRSNTDRLNLLKRAEKLLGTHDGSQWTARLLALRGRLTIDDEPSALHELKRALNLYQDSVNLLAANDLARFIADAERRLSHINLDEIHQSVPRLENEELAPPEKNETATIHVESNWTEHITINTSLPGEAVKTVHVPIEPASALDQLLAFETYENYSFAFLRMMFSDWIKCCFELGSILMRESDAQKLQAFAGAAERKPALALIVEALQMASAPWEMMTLPSQSDGPASISPALSAFYRSLPPDERSSGRAVRSLPDIVWLQLALTQLGPQRILADGIYGRATKEAVRNFQRSSGLPDHGTFDGPTRRALKLALQAHEGRDRPRVLLLQPSIERQRATSRGTDLYGVNLHELYERHGFREVALVEDPDVGKVQEVLRGFKPEVVHICPTLGESTSIGIYLDFGTGGTGVMPKGSASQSQARKSPTGDVEFLTLSALSDLIRRHQKPEAARPLLILDVLRPPNRTDLFTQLFLRNGFAAQLYQLGAFESVIATGLTQPGLHEMMSHTLLEALKSFDSIGETVNRMRRTADVGSYTHLAPVGDQPGPLRDPNDEEYLFTVVGTAGIALFTQDPEMKSSASEAHSMVAIDLSRRKKIELQQKLASLQSEFEDWRAKSKAYQPLEKHHSQIHRVTLQLEGLTNQIKSELDNLPNTGTGVLSRARDLEYAILESHRVWEFFRSKLSLRSIEWFNKYLIAADELAWECYSAAQRKLDPKYLAKEEVKEPPLVFFNGGSSPFTMPRNYAFEAEAVAEEAIESTQVIALLRALPIPVIGVPWFQIQHLPEMLVVAHEVGHDVESDFKLTDDLTIAVDKAMAAAKIDAGHQLAWRAWLGEIFADVYGVLSCGPAYVQSLIDFLATDPDQTTRATQTAPHWGLYPTDYLRVLVNIEALDEAEFEDERKRLRDQWTAIYTTHAMPGYVDDIPTVVAAIINGPYTAFGGASLTDVISFSAADQYRTESDANRLGQGAGPEASNTRILFAAASTIYARDPEKYGKLKMQQRVLDHVTHIRKAGVRGSQTTVGPKLGTLDAEDKEAGEKLFALLAKN